MSRLSAVQSYPEVYEDEIALLVLEVRLSLAPSFSI